jgi:adenylate cyclase class IV
MTPLQRLRQEYIHSLGFHASSKIRKQRKNSYNAMRLFCLDTQLISFNDIELMEFEVNQSF